MCCPICGSKEYEIMFRHARLANVRRTYSSKQSQNKFMTSLNTSLCKYCGFLYRTPLLSEQEQRNYYESKYYETYKPKKPHEIENNLDYYNENNKKYYVYVNYLKENNINLINKRVLDIGAGRGSFLFTCQKEKPLYLLGIEPSKASCNMALKFDHRNFDILQGCLEDHPVSKIGKFDLVAMIGVIEHLSNSKKMLSEVRKYIEDDGCLYIYTHNEFPNIFLDINRQISLVHQLYFTRKTMVLLLKSAGFSTTCMKTNPGVMHVVAHKVSSSYSFSPSYKLTKAEYKILKFRYLFYKHLPHIVYTCTKLCRRLFLIPGKCINDPKRFLSRLREFLKIV